ncbi:MAG: 16S rRNA (guanine(527)-N(7))-methyltransferase RsmG [Planctomycetota bacterium]|nr:MAG: 16S rRNA (guanine(527)-N(7))-methyltransferase RsmG [Planctomycetota bacterium]
MTPAMTLAELQSFGIDIDEPAYGRLERFVDLLLAENRKTNLTAIRERADAWLVHVCESLAVLPLLDDSSASSLIDIGCGGGVPGIPLACARPRIDVALLDATRKKIEACERIANGLRLSNVATIWSRAERAAHDPRYREQFEVVTARAVAALPLLAEYAAGFVQPGGRCIFFKTRQALERESSAAAGALRSCRLSHEQTLEYDLGPHGRRVVAVYRKLAALPSRLPRSPGQAKKRPL